MLAAAIVLRSFFARSAGGAPRREAVTLLKPLHGDEPRLVDNLASFLDQYHGGPVQLLCGVQRADDPAIAAVEALRARHPDATIDLVVDPTVHGASGKISNLINMTVHAVHPIVILSDSDMIVAPDYLARILAALDVPGVGAVSCAFGGRGDAGFWSRLAAAGPSYQFLPGVVFAAATGLGRPCMGSTIALRRTTLDRIGGFAAFADILADDHAIGEAIHALGLRVAIPPMLVTHASVERGFGALWRHELRWGATVRGVVPAAYAGSIVGFPLPLALLGLPYWPAAGAVLATAALVVRLWIKRLVDRAAGVATAPAWLLPIRDCLSFAIFVASFFPRAVDWRGTRLGLDRGGRIVPGAES